MSIRRSRVSLLAIVLLSIVSFGFFPMHVFAQSASDSALNVATTAGLGTNSLTSIIGTIISVFLGLLGVIFLILVIYAGFIWMTAAGDEKKIEKAKKILTSAVIGLLITMFSYAITTFIINAIGNATGANVGGTTNGTVSTELLSGSLGSGAISDHYPTRNQTDVARNTNIMVTFKSAMDIPSFISGYDTAGTSTDISDDVTATAINSANIAIYITADGESAALTDATVTFSSDLKTFVFDPAEYLGSPTEDVQYTVFLSPNIKDANGATVFTGSNSDGYEWSFETGTNVDTEPPSVTSVTPVSGGTYDRNILVQITFSEAVDPTTATGTRGSTSGFDKIIVGDFSNVPVPGTYSISNAYKTVTFVPSSACGTNSCNQTIYCLPASQPIQTSVKAASLSTNPPTANAPYDGIVDMAGNSLDGNGDKVAGDSYGWGFSTSGNINLTGPKITAVTPNIKEEDVALDQNIEVTFDSVLESSTVSSDNIALSDKELSTGDVHDLWYRFESTSLTSSGEEVISTSQIPSMTKVSIPHGTFLESADGKTYVYGVNVGNGILNEYQNCYVPAKGPDASGGTCAVTQTQPYCCNGQPSATTCSLF